MLERAPYADSKPLSVNKVYHVKFSLMPPRIFIYLAPREKQKNKVLDGIMVISFFFISLHPPGRNGELVIF